MANQFDHRTASVILSDTATVRQGQPDRFSDADHRNPSKLPIPRYWVSESEVIARIEGNRLPALLGFTDVTSPTNERSMLASLIPFVGVGHTMPLISSTRSISELTHLEANLNSFILDYIGRQKLGGIHYTFFIVRQLPVVPPDAYGQMDLLWRTFEPRWLLLRVVELTYTSNDMQLFSKSCGYDGPPFVWDEERRFGIRAELDAAYFHLYLGTEEDWKTGTKELLSYFSTPRDAVKYIMETFPIVKRKDEQKYGSYRTKKMILEIYNKMAEAIKTGQAYETILDPPPADPSVAHPPRDSVKASVTEKINPIFTIGHSNTSVDKLVSLLKQNKIQVLADVRSVPYSRHVPQANREAIERAIKAAGIKYLFIGEQLGGRPKDIKIKDEQGNLDYSKLASTERFREGMDRLLKGASQYYVCLMCSEEDPSRCHRSLLISRELDKLGVEVHHIRRDGHIETQRELEKQIPPAQEGLFSEK